MAHNETPPIKPQIWWCAPSRENNISLQLFVIARRTHQAIPSPRCAGGAGYLAGRHDARHQCTEERRRQSRPAPWPTTRRSPAPVRRESPCRNATAGEIIGLRASPRPDAALRKALPERHAPPLALNTPELLCWRIKSAPTAWSADRAAVQEFNIHVPSGTKCVLVSLVAGRARAAELFGREFVTLSIRLRGKKRVAGLSVVRRRRSNPPRRAS